MIFVYKEPIYLKGLSSPIFQNDDCQNDDDDEFEIFGDVLNYGKYKGL